MVWNCSFVKVVFWVEKYFGQVVIIVVEVVEGVEFVMVCVGNDDDLWQVCIGFDGVFVGMVVGVVFVDYIIVLVVVMWELLVIVGEQGFGFLDVLVLGGQVGVENGQFLVMCGGLVVDYVVVELVIVVYVKICCLMGFLGVG